MMVGSKRNAVADGLPLAERESQPKEALMALPGSGAEMQRSAKDKLMRDLEGTIAKMST